MTEKAIECVRHSCTIDEENIQFLIYSLGSKQCFIWIGQEPDLNNLHYGVPCEEALSTCLLGSINSPGSSLAALLSKQ